MIQPGSAEYVFLLSVSGGVIVAKCVISVLLLRWLFIPRSPLPQRGRTLVAGVAGLLVSLLVSRLLWTYLDFYLIRFDTAQILSSSNLLVYKLAAASSSVGFVCALLTVEGVLLRFQLKGLPALAMAG